MKLSYNDAQHSYWLDGHRCKSVTSVAKIPDDTYNLEQWRKRQLLIGVATMPELVEQAAAHHDDRDQLDRIAEEALAAAKSSLAANRGQAAHRITERVDLNELILDSPQAQAVEAAWLRALELAGLEIVPEYVERIVIYPERFIAGRADRFARRKTDGRLVVLDLKTGSSAVKYPHSTAIQLALYANAPGMAGPVPRSGGWTTKFEPMPDIDTTVGYVVHMENEGEVDVVALDLEKAKRGMEICFATLNWRKEDLLIPVTEVNVEPSNIVNIDSARRANWITDRLKVIANYGADAKHAMAVCWPTDTPTRPPWTDKDIEELDIALAGVEAKYEIPWGEHPTNFADLKAKYATRKGTNHE